MFETVIVFAIVIFTQLTKGFIYPKFGNTGVHVAAFIVAMIGVGIYQIALSNPSIMEWVLSALTYLALAISIYEIILSKIGFTSAKEQTEDNYGG